MSFTWKATPPGKEQKLLNKILKAKTFNCNSTPSEIKAQYKEFAHVSPETFRNHFNLSKAKLGIGLVEKKEVDEATTSYTPSKKFKKSLEPDEEEKLSFENPPVLITEYIDPETEEQKVIIVAMMFGGTKNFNFKLSDAGDFLSIFYDWPQCGYEIKDLFADKIISEPVKAYARINALKETLSKLRDSKTEVPSGVFKIKLPFLVQTDKRSWKAEGFETENGSMAAVIDLTGIQSSYTITEKDTSIVFKKIKINKE